MLFQDDPTEQKPDIDNLDQQRSNGSGSGDEPCSNDPEEDTQSKDVNLDKDDDEDGLEQGYPESTNGHQDQTSPKNGDLEENSGDFNPKIESVGTVDGQEGDVGVRMTQLEKEISSLECLLMSKELEWNAILRLKKLKELLLEQLRREGDIANILGSVEGKDMNSLAKECLLLEEKHIDKLSTDTKSLSSNIKSEISKMELEITEIRGNRYQPPRGQVSVPMSLEHRNASLALRQLSEKNSAELKQGRNGPIVPVTTLIADYRAKRKQESPIIARKRSRPSKPVTHSTSSTTISYSDVLLSLAKISSNDNKSASPEVTNNSNSTPVNSPKVNSRGGNSITSNKSNITLAKLLSSSGGSTNSGSHRLDDNKSASEEYKGRHANTAGNPDTSISLSNLLASNNKARNEPSQKAESIPICQGCNRSQAQFVCAGCGSQWYCSRECQVEAWDDHAESCSG